MAIETQLDAIHFLTGRWALRPAEIGHVFTAEEVETWEPGVAIQRAREILAAMIKPTPAPRRNAQGLTPKAAEFIAQNPTVLGTYPGGTFYEHPTRGDTAAIFTIGLYGQLIDTGFYDLGDPDDILDEIDDANERWSENHPEAEQ